MASVTRQSDSRIRVTVFGSSGAAPDGHDMLSAPSISYYFPANTKLITLGRGNAAPPTIIDIVVGGSSLSKAHCAITVHGNEGTPSSRPLSFSVSDLGSANGTTIRPVVLRGFGPAFEAAYQLVPTEAKEMLSFLQSIESGANQLSMTKTLLSQLVTKDFSTPDNNDACMKKLLTYADPSHAPCKLAPLTATPIDHRHNVIAVGKLNSIIISVTDLAFPSFDRPNPQTKTVAGTTSILWSDLAIMCQTIKELTATVVAQQQQITNLRSQLLDATPNKDAKASGYGIGSATPIEQSPQQPGGANARVPPSSTASGSLPHGSSTVTFLSSTSLGSQQAGPSSAAPPPKAPLPPTLMANPDVESPSKPNGYPTIAATLPDPHAAAAAAASVSVHFAATLIVNDDDVNVSQSNNVKAPLPPTLQVNYDSSTDDDDSHHVPPPVVTTREAPNHSSNNTPQLFSVNAGGRGKSDAINALFQAVSPAAPKSDPPTEVDEDENTTSTPAPVRGQPPNPTPKTDAKETNILAPSSLVNTDSPTSASRGAPPPPPPPPQPLQGRVPATDSDDDDNVAPPPAVRPEQNPLLSDFFRKPTVPVNNLAPDSQEDDDDDDANVAVPAPCKSGGNPNRGANPVPTPPSATAQPSIANTKRARSPTAAASNDDAKDAYGTAPPPARGAPQHNNDNGAAPQGRQPVSHTQVLPAIVPATNPRGAQKEDEATDEDTDIAPTTRGTAPPSVPQPSPVSTTYIPPTAASTTYVPRGQTSTSVPVAAAAPLNSSTYVPATAAPSPRGPVPVASTPVSTTYVPSTTYIPAGIAATTNITSVASAEHSTSTPASAPTTTAVMAKAIWQFKTDLRKGNKNDAAWSSYSDGDSAIIEAAHVLFEAANGTVAKKKVQTAPLNATYSVNFREMIQYRNDDENRQRPIRRKP